MKIIGIRSVDFADRNDPNKRVTGINIFGTYPITKNGEGFSTEKVFLNQWFIENVLMGEIPRVGDEIEVLYNKMGRLSGLRVVEAAV